LLLLNKFLLIPMILSLKDLYARFSLISSDL